MPTGEPLNVTVQRIDDALYRVGKHNTADKVEARQFAEDLKDTHPEWIDPGFQARAYAEREQRLIDPQAPYSPDVEAYFKAMEPLIKEERRLYAEVERKISERKGEYSTVTAMEDGYIHRKVQGKEPFGEPLDPDTLKSADVITGIGGRSLPKTASSLEQRNFFVLQDQTGRRVFNQKKLGDTEWKYGDKIEAGGKEWEVKPATTAEIEANVPGLKYHKNHIANTLDNVLRLKRINRNIDLLNHLKTELKENKLWMPQQAEARHDPSWVHVDLPQMQGWADPKIAKVLNDYFHPRGSDADNWMTAINRRLIGSMFLTPVPHAGNVGAHWLVGRGWDWINAPHYRELQKTGTQAWNEVINQGPTYRQLMREGAGFLYADVANQNFYKVMLEKLFNEQLADPAPWAPIAQRFGFSQKTGDALDAVKNMVAKQYEVSSKMLWAINDVFLMQRVLELKGRGLPVREAIRQAERDIPNYRIPQEVMGSPALASAMKSPNLMNFGRYKYGQLKAYGAILNDRMVRSANRWARANDGGTQGSGGQGAGSADHGDRALSGS
jgi:hypothetical protein